MGVDLSRLKRAPGIAVEADHIVVELRDSRRHRVTVREDPECFRLTALVARRAAVEGVPEAPLLAWLRNRESRLVGFRIDEAGRLVANAWVPKAGLTAGELELYVRTIAAEADRFEFALTGRDCE